MQHCFYLREDVETELDNAFSFDLRYLEVFIFQYFLDNLPIEDSEAHLSNKLWVLLVPTLTIVYWLQLFVEFSVLNFFFRPPLELQFIVYAICGYRNTSEIALFFAPRY